MSRSQRVSLAFTLSRPLEAENDVGAPQMGNCRRRSRIQAGDPGSLGRPGAPRPSSRSSRHGPPAFACCFLLQIFGRKTSMLRKAEREGKQLEKRRSAVNLLMISQYFTYHMQHDQVKDTGRKACN